MIYGSTKRDWLTRQRQALLTERSSFDAHWRSLGDYILPTRPRFNITDTNRGDRRNHLILDNTGTIGARILSSGMQAGITSPARRWFRLTTPDPKMAEAQDVKEWLHDVTTAMEDALARSNFYNVTPAIYSDLGVFGTTAVHMVEDFDDVVRFYSYPVGSYAIGTDHRGKVGVFFREFEYTVRQVVERFGEQDSEGKYDLSNFSSTVKNYWQKGEKEQKVWICHMIYANPDYKPESENPKFKKFASVYWEKNVNTHEAKEEKYLLETGFDYFPVMAPRWTVSGEDVYATSCPGMIALGDIKELQKKRKKILKALDKMIDPPLQGSPALRQVRKSLLPGDTSYTVFGPTDKGLSPIHEVRFNVAEMKEDMEATRIRIDRAFFVDLLLMLARTTRRQITAREIDERDQEKLIGLGPVLEQLNQDFLDPTIENLFLIMERRGMIPEPPESLVQEGVALKIEYVSFMAQAQKFTGLQAIENIVGFGLELAAVDASALDKLDIDQAIDEYAQLNGASPRLIRSDDDVAEIRERKAEMQRAQAAAESAKALSGSAKDLAGAGLEDDNALKRLLSAGAGAPQ